MVRAGEEGVYFRHAPLPAAMTEHLSPAALQSIIYPFLVWLILLIDFALVFFCHTKIVDMYQNPTAK